MVKKYDITEFFEIFKIMFNKKDETGNKSKKLTSNISDKPGDQRTNVIYLNTDCNLRCEYCYEENSRTGLEDQVNCTQSDIDNFLNEICIREKDLTSTVVLMGGEPFLKFELIEYAVLKAASLTKTKGTGWGFSIISNGTLFTDKILNRYKELITIASTHKVHITQEVSYDVTGQYRRKWPDGSSSIKHVERGIQKLIEFEMPFRLSYTVHSGNYKNLLKDCIYILEKYPIKYHDRMTVGWAYKDLDFTLGYGAAEKLKSEFEPYANYLLDKYGVPICGNTCNHCSICRSSNFVGNSYLSPTTGITYDNKKTEHNFQQF